MLKRINAVIFTVLLSVSILGRALADDDLKPNAQTRSSAATASAKSSDTHNIYETADLAAILDAVDRDTLVVFDLDYTIFRSKTNLGKPEWLMHLVKKETEKGVSKKEGLIRYFPVWMRAQKLNELELMDERMPDIFAEIRRKAVAMIGYTVRPPMSAEVTLWQIHKFSLEFFQGSIGEFNYVAQFEYPSVYREGVLFAHGFNEKGTVFAEWLRQAQPHLRQRSIKRIVFVDDELENHLSMEKAALALGLEYFGFRYTAADKYKANFNAKLVDQEYEILMSNHSESELQLLLQDIGSYASSEGQ